MANRWPAVVLLVLVTACGHDEDVVVTTPCEQLREHLIELQLADANSIDREAHSAILRRNLGDTFISSCESSLSSAQLDCVLRADDSESASACIASTAGDQ